LRREELEVLLKSHRRAMFFYAYKRIQRWSHHDAEDIVSDAILLCYQKCASYHDGLDPEYETSNRLFWIFNNIRDVCQAHGRDSRKYDKEKKAQEMNEWDELSTGGTDWMSVEFLHEARYRLRHTELSDKALRCVALRLEGLSRVEIARAMGEKENTIKTILARSFEAIRHNPMRSSAPPLRAAGYLFWLGSRVAVYSPPTKTGTALANIRLRRMR
jgi:RNA polymerase sigma factor (sigma-70 family)